MAEKEGPIQLMALGRPFGLGMLYDYIESKVSPTATWSKNGITVAGGNDEGDKLNQINCPCGFFVEENGTLLIADTDNHRIVEWKRGDTTGRIVAGGNGQGGEDNQLKWPSDVIVDPQNNSLLICDLWNYRVMRWFRQNGTTRGEIIIDSISCNGITMDNEGSLYVTNDNKHEVRRYARGDKNGTIVAGGNGKGDNLNQLNYPYYVFVDREHSVYVSDSNNHRVMKWVKGSKEGIVIAGGRGRGEDLTQLSGPRGIFVDELGTLYVAEWGNHRVTRWYKGENKGNIVVGGNGRGNRADQFNCPVGLSFDADGNLYVVDCRNHRVQRFALEKN